MHLLTKSILEPAKKTDGIRICIMRRIKPEFSFDIWIPQLAASTELLDKYQQNKISWDEFEKLYKKEVIQQQTTYFDILLDIVKKHPTTLLCREATPEKCHRRLAAQHLKQISPAIELTLN